MITISRPTHRDACLSGATDAEDTELYEAGIAGYEAWLIEQALSDGLELTWSDEASTYSYRADTDAEHQWVQASVDFWTWAN